ncbi:MAG TPA: sigma-70 family RNA polymerase sigma factor [Opitutaceae bacterium]|nr:sigma-70 family RNA polymerase sigma factor [Opitutaceae bacterium]
MERNSVAPFPVTRWSVVFQARQDGSPEHSRAALEELCRQYWFPLYAFARRRGHAPADAEDLTQNFFAELLVSRLFAVADPAQGRLRTFLLTAFQRRMADHHRRDCAQKRGGGQAIVSIDLDEAEHRFRAELADSETPESAYELRWAVTLLDAAMSALEQEYAAAEKQSYFEALRPFLTASQAHAEGYVVLAARLGLSKVAARQAVHRLRERFRFILRRCVADTLRDPTPAAVDEELGALKSVLARSGL